MIDPFTSTFPLVRCFKSKVNKILWCEACWHKMDHNKPHPTIVCGNLLPEANKPQEAK